MQSKIRIEYDFETKEPVLQIKLEVGSDDLRDQMLRAFIEDAGSIDNRLYLTYNYDTPNTQTINVRVGKIHPDNN